MFDKKKIRKYIGYKMAEYGKYLKWVPDKIYLSVIYRILLNEKMNIKNPLSYTQKLQWLKVYDKKERYHILVDKYKVRKYVSDKIGEEYLIPLINVYENVEEIKWDELPREFVLKATHTSGDVIICKNKLDLDKEKCIKEMQGWLKRDYYSFFREWPYKNLTPRIVCEEFISEIGDVPVDYKIMCFSGKPKIIQVHHGRFSNHTIEYYDICWNKIDIYSEGYSIATNVTRRPQQLNKMLEIAQKLSTGLPQSRIDLYLVNNKIFFSEITFFDGAGFDKFYPEEYNDYLGSLINLEEIIYES